ncbi:MAG TPA: NAD(+)/NADH kinase [Candidatus Sulfotelmatobacter sp.]|jgi:NAD+ kinase|nr:NAD(+)/NADH kinase [Candidatus Sulfotelmatobacter sp.]
MARRVRAARPHAPPAIRRVAILAKPGSREGVRIARELADWLHARGIAVRLDRATASAMRRPDGIPTGTLPPRTDLVVVAGGDGSLLAAARAAIPRGVPILGVNFGGLGFLTELQPEELFGGLEKVLRGEAAIEEREALRVRLRRGGRVVADHVLLNDAVVAKTALARMLDIEVSIDGEHVATYTSDGLIVATPTGSTAYNLSAGGPILDPRMSAFVIAPICPHTMSYRPLVVPGGVVIRVVLRSDTEEAYLTLDGQVGAPMRPMDEIVVDRHPSPVRLVRVARRGFFEILQRKLRWGGR